MMHMVGLGMGFFYPLSVNEGFESDLNGDGYVVLQYLMKLFSKNLDQSKYFPKIERKVKKKFNFSEIEISSIWDELLAKDAIVIEEDQIKVDIMGNSIRKKIYKLIKKYPGVYTNFIIDNLNLGTGQGLWHLQTLREYGKIKSVECGNFCSYGPVNTSKEEIVIGTLLLRDTLRDILSFLVHLGKPATMKDLTSSLNLARSSITYNLQHLSDLDLLKKRKEGKKNVYEIESKYQKYVENSLQKFYQLQKK